MTNEYIELSILHKNFEGRFHCEVKLLDYSSFCKSTLEPIIGIHLSA